MAKTSDSPEQRLMRRALRLAAKAQALGEVPVGALVVQGALDGRRPVILARAHNRTHTRQDPAGHAEMLALRKAAAKKKSWRLTDCTLVVTLEPCAMCAGAGVLSRIGKIIYGAHDPKAGACGSALQVARHPKLNHRPPVVAGVLEKECSQMLTAFFRKRRAAAKGKTQK